MTLSMGEAVVPKEKEFVAFEDDIAYALMELWEIDHGDATGVMWCHKELIKSSWEANVPANEVARQIDSKGESTNDKTEVDETTLTIRNQNDYCRAQIHIHEGLRKYPCKVFHSQGIEAFTNGEKIEIYTIVRKYNEFTIENDSHREHDFGAFDFKDTRIFWKIDYYTHDLLNGSEDPSDPAKTMRVMNILLASEY